jgi:hypothetical protein
MNCNMCICNEPYVQLIIAARSLKSMQVDNSNLHWLLNVNVFCINAFIEIYVYINTYTNLLRLQHEKCFFNRSRPSTRMLTRQSGQIQNTRCHCRREGTA